MKQLIFILAIGMILASCSKDPPAQAAPQQVGRFMATVDLKPTSQTNYYDLFVANTTDTAFIGWRWVKRITVLDLHYGSVMGFDLDPYWCNGILYVTPEKKLYGATRENSYGNITHAMDYRSVKAIK